MRWLSTLLLPLCLTVTACTSGSYDLMDTASVSPRFQDTDPQHFDGKTPHRHEVHGIDASHAVAFSERATLNWTVEVGDLSRRFYSYQITYFVAPDQTPHTQPQVHTDKPLLVVPRWQPAP